MWIALLTDFGLSEYVGVLKGEIWRRQPDVKIIDLFHEVTPFAIREAAWILLAHRRSFPPGTVFLAVVDPGVGTRRQAVAVGTRAGYYYVGPDNGLLYPAAWADGDPRAVALEIPEGASSTFHGRDVFAPAAARLAGGCPLEELGPPVELEAKLLFHMQGREGEIVRIDRFGNIITNLPPTGQEQYHAVLADGSRRTLPFFPTYGVAPRGQLFVTTGSAGTLEIALREDAASRELPVRVGQRVVLE